MDNSPEETIYSIILKDICQEIVLATYCECRSNELNSVPETHKKHIDTIKLYSLYSNFSDSHNNRVSDQAFVCPNCKSTVTIQRFAIHLEKCINKSSSRMNT